MATDGPRTARDAFAENVYRSGSFGVHPEKIKQSARGRSKCPNSHAL